MEAEMNQRQRNSTKDCGDSVVVCVRESVCVNNDKKRCWQDLIILWKKCTKLNSRFKYTIAEFCAVFYKRIKMVHPQGIGKMKSPAKDFFADFVRHSFNISVEI